MVEVHNDPAKALCDGPQSLTPEQFDTLMKKVNKTRILSGIITRKILHRNCKLGYTITKERKTTRESIDFGCLSVYRFYGKGEISYESNRRTGESGKEI